MSKVYGYALGLVVLGAILLAPSALAGCSGLSCQQACEGGVCGDMKCGYQENGDCECEIKTRPPKTKLISLPQEIRNSYPEILDVFEIFRGREGISLAAGEHKIAVTRSLGRHPETGEQAYEKAVTGKVDIEFDGGQVRIDLQIGETTAFGEVGADGESGFLHIDSDAGYDYLTW